MEVEVEVKRLIIPDSTDIDNEVDNSALSLYTTDKMELRVSKLLVSYVLQTTEFF